MSLLLRAADVSFAYEQRPVLRGISVHLHAGQVLSLLGPNGSGKSTLIKILLGHLHGGGHVELDGRPIRAWRRRQLARRVAYLPQTPAFEPGQSVREVLRLGRAPYWGAFGLESEHDQRVIAEVASLLELDDLLDRPVDHLSGGQRQRALIGRCLTQEPAALLLDEPNTYLDLRHQVDLLKLLRNLSRQRGLGVLMASHDLNLAGLFADQMVLLKDGQVAAAGTPDAVLRPELLGDVYGVPMDRIQRPDGLPFVVPLVR